MTEIIGDKPIARCRIKEYLQNGILQLLTRYLYKKEISCGWFNSSLLYYNIFNPVKRDIIHGIENLRQSS